MNYQKILQLTLLVSSLFLLTACPSATTGSGLRSTAREEGHGAYGNVSPQDAYSGGFDEPKPEAKPETHHETAHVDTPHPCHPHICHPHGCH